MEDILTRFKDERILLSLSDPAIGIRGDLFIAESTIFAARVEKPSIEGYAALRNLCQFAGAEFALSKYERTEQDPAKRTMCIDLAKLIKSVASLPVDPSSLLSSDALMNKTPLNSVVGAPVVIAVPPMQLPPLPPPGTEYPQPDEQKSSSAKQRIDQAFEAAVQKRVAAKGKESPLAMRKAAVASSGTAAEAPTSHPQGVQPALPTSNGDGTNGGSKLAKAAAMLASAPSTTPAPPAPALAPVPLPSPTLPAPPPTPTPTPTPTLTPTPTPAPIPAAAPAIAKAPAPLPTSLPASPSVPKPSPPVLQNAVGLGTGEIDWHAVRESAKKVEPVSKEPTLQFSLAEQIQQELSASDEEEEVAEPIKRQALKRSFVGPLAAVRLFTAKIGRLVLPIAIIIVVFQGGKLWLDAHGGSAAMKLPTFDFFGKQNKKAPAPTVHKESTKTVRAPSHRDVASHSAVSHQSSAKSASGHSSAVKAAASPKDSTKNIGAKAAAPASSATSNNSTAGTERIVGTGSSKYPNSLIMRDQIKPSVQLPPRRHAYQTAPDAGDDSK
ncbi:MAG: hypothetical protein P4L53_14045 [Candidatus Obscuribacterales bacterium]|nr:hypothetical protein [Candidatus Obscuribacterales bacterium]